MALLIIAFIAGLLTVLAPCTLPLLPVIVGGSVGGERSIRRALVICASLGASVFIFTLLLKASTVFIAVPQSALEYVSGGLLIIFGVVTLFPSLWENIPFLNSINLKSNRLLGTGYTKGGLAGDIIMGAALGPVFSSCSPTYFIVLATVLPVHPAEGVVYLLTYCAGLVLSLLAVAYLGQRVVGALGIASDPRGWFKRVVGALFILIGIVVATGYSATLESELLSHAGIFDVTKIEQQLLQGRGSATSVSGQKAPEITNPSGFINTDGQPITLSQYIGKDVVLVDFWTYSCINCLRTVPYLNAWYQKYHDEGLVIIGIHTPEFAFEHVLSNVQSAVTSLGIKYPVVLDNDYGTWNAFGNQYWPNEYLIDINGNIVDNHSGEGDYDTTEAAIQAALQQRNTQLGSTTPISTGTVDVTQQDLSAIESPETYFGSNRNEYLGNGVAGQAGVQSFALPQSVEPNTLYLGGSWNIAPEFATAPSGAQIEYEYDAHDIYMVASAPTPVTLQISVDGKPANSVVVQQDKLYTLVHNTTSGVHTILITTEGAGLQAYTFTFG
jgi:cytochrome c biogenesis protein CcdA/thiol-disulfide isomerase/thioredoxin